MIGILVGTASGLVLGAVSGLIPGVHSNTVAGVLLGLQPVLLPLFGAEALIAAMFATLITHTFLDTIPSTFLGVPDPDTALAVLPAHALTLEGSGEEAVRIAALGSVCGLIASIPLILPFFFLLPAMQPFLDWGMGLVLVAVAGYLIISCESASWALATFLISGITGIFAIHYSYLSWNVAGGTAILMPLLCGLFGIPVLILATAGTLPQQNFSGIHMKGSEITRGTLRGTIAGAIVGWLPGLSNATANAFLASATGFDWGRREYILATSAANTANVMIGLAALFSIARTRNGVMVAMATLEPPSIIPLLCVAVLAGGLAYLLTIRIARHAVLLGGINIRRLNIAVIVFVSMLSLILTGPFGGVILILATLSGIVPGLVGVPRLHCMGAIVLPVILFAFGFPV